MQENSICLSRALELLGSKWTISILWRLCSEPKGFNQLSRELEGISPRVLSVRLKELVEADLASKTIHPTNPPTVEYALTQKGLSLRPILQSLQSWNTTN